MAQHTFAIYITKRAQKTILLFERPPTVMAISVIQIDCLHESEDHKILNVSILWAMTHILGLSREWHDSSHVLWYISWKGSGPRGYYVLTEWVGGLDGKIFGPRPWSMDQAQRALWVMNESQTFFRSGPPTHSITILSCDYWRRFEKFENFVQLK